MANKKTSYMTDEVTLRQYRKDDEDQIIPLLQAVFKGWPHFNLECSPKDHWKWKYRDNPNGEGGIAVAEKKDRIIGCFHLLTTKMKAGSNIYSCIQSTDTAVHPNYQGIGVYTKLYKMTDDVIDLTKVGLQYGISTHPVVNKTVKKIESDRIEKEVRSMIRIRDVNKLKGMDGLSKKIPLIYAAKAVNATLNVFSSREKSTRNKYNIIDVDRFDDSFNDLLQNLMSEYVFMTELSHKYLNWRYFDVRGGNYIVKAAEEGGLITGFIVLRVNLYEESQPTGYFVGLYCPKDKTDCLRALIEESIGYFNEAGCNVVNVFTTPRHPYEKMFGYYGFLDSRLGIKMPIRPKKIGEDYKKIKDSNPSEMLLQYGDFDWI